MLPAGNSTFFKQLDSSELSELFIFLGSLKVQCKGN